MIEFFNWSLMLIVASTADLIIRTCKSGSLIISTGIRTLGRCVPVQCMAAFTTVAFVVDGHNFLIIHIEQSTTTEAKLNIDIRDISLFV